MVPIVHRVLFPNVLGVKQSPITLRFPHLHCLISMAFGQLKFESPQS